MIPILYENNETAFSSNGLGRLSDCLSCLVTEERNGQYEVEFTYPVSGVLFDEITIGRIIACTHNEQGDVQPFDIYAKSEPIGGVVTFNARHISYRLNGITVKPFSAGSCSQAIAGLKTNSIGTNPFTFWTDKTVTATYNLDTPHGLKELLSGEENSMLDVFGTGEYEYDKFTVKLHLHRGQDTNVSIRYGKNLVDLTNDYNAGDIHTAVVPYWLGSETVQSGDESQTVTVLVTLPEWYISSGHSSPGGREIMVPMDLSTEFNEKPTESQLRDLATSKLNSSDAWMPSQTLTVNFVQLWQTEEYKDYAPLQRLKLCDTCGVFVPMYNISLRVKVVKVVYNTLLDRYDSMELGDKLTTYAAVLEKQYDYKVAGLIEGLQTLSIDIGTVEANAKAYTDSEISDATTDITTAYEQAIQDATDLIRGGDGGYIVTTVNANGQPIELLITDNLDINQAVNIWRWNLGGLAHSHNGYAGPFDDVAITQDGKINASMILTGALTANLITAGTITDDSGLNYWNLDSGQFVTKQGQIAVFTIVNNSLSYTTERQAGSIYSVVIRAGGIETGTDYQGSSMTSNSQITLGTRSLTFDQTSSESNYGEKSESYYIETSPIYASGYGYEIPLVIGYGNPGQYHYFVEFQSGNVNSTSTNRILFDYNVLMRSNLKVNGTKERIVKTENYSDRGLYCYETPTPLFGDIGEAILDSDGICYVELDDIFTETIANKIEYQVFLQKEGEGDCWIADKTPRFFVIQGTPGLKVAWELKAKQRDYETLRLEPSDYYLNEYAEPDNMDTYFEDYINEQEELLYG